MCRSKHISGPPTGMFYLGWAHISDEWDDGLCTRQTVDNWHKTHFYSSPVIPIIVIAFDTHFIHFTATNLNPCEWYEPASGNATSTISIHHTQLLTRIMCNFWMLQFNVFIWYVYKRINTFSDQIAVRAQWALSIVSHSTQRPIWLSPLQDRVSN